MKIGQHKARYRVVLTDMENKKHKTISLFTDKDCFDEIYQAIGKTLKEKYGGGQDASRNR